MPILERCAELEKDSRELLESHPQDFPSDLAFLLEEYEQGLACGNLNPQQLSCLHQLRHF